MATLIPPTDSDHIILLVCSFAHSCLYAFLICRLLRPDHGTRRFVAATLAWCAASAVVVTLLIDEYWWAQAICWSGWTAYAAVCSDRRIMVALAATASAWASGVVGTLVASTVASHTFKNVTFGDLSAETDYLATTLLMLTVQALVTIAVVAFRHRRAASTREKANLAFAAWVILQGFTLCVYQFFSRHVRELGPVYDVPIMALGASYLVLAALYMVHTRNIARRKAADAAIADEMRAQHERFEVLSTELGRVRRVRHDLNNHMTVLASLAQSGRKEEALAYLDTLAETLDRDQPRQEGDLAPYIALVASQAALLRERGVELSCQAISSIEPDRAQALDPLIIWVTRLAQRILQHREGASVGILFADDGLQIDCVLRPCSESEVLRAFHEEAEKTLRIPVNMDITGSDGTSVTLRARLSMDQLGARDLSRLA